jgi:hypothetical protein
MICPFHKVHVSAIRTLYDGREEMMIKNKPDTEKSAPGEGKANDN